MKLGSEVLISKHQL